MATVTGYTSAKMNEMRDANITSAYVSDGNDGFSSGDLILVPFGWATDPVTYPKINLGDVTGPQGIQGPTGEVTTVALNAAIADVEAQIAAAHGTGAISQTMLADLAVSTAKLASLAVTTAKIADLNVTEGKIAAGAVTETKIGSGAVTNTKIGAGAVTLSKMAANSVDSAQYVDLSIDREHISNGAISGEKLDVDVVDSQHVAAGAIDAEHVSSGAITLPKLNYAHGYAYRSSNVGVSTSPTALIQTASNISAPAGSLLICSISVDLSWTDNPEDWADLVEVYLSINGTEPLGGRIIAKPYKAPQPTTTRLTFGRTFIRTLPSTLTNAYLAVVVGAISNLNTITLHGGSDGASHSRLEYAIIRQS